LADKNNRGGWGLALLGGTIVAAIIVGNGGMPKFAPVKTDSGTAQAAQAAQAAPPLPAVGVARFHCPVPGAPVTQGFGPSWVMVNRVYIEPPYNGYSHFHVGLDLAKPQGAPIAAAEAGIVEKVDRNGYGTGKSAGYGNSVWIQVAQNREEFYGHLYVIAGNIQPGQHVAAGQIIGQVGSTGESTGPHLHFGVQEGGRWVDPAPMMNPC